MGVCDACGNEFEGAFTLSSATGERWTFDSFECAIHVAAPRCTHCGCPVIGHGVQVDSDVYCCSHCARARTDADLTDHPRER